MPGVWSLPNTELGQVDEYSAFSHSITYTNAELGGTYSVRVISSQTNPDTVYVSGNNISGYFTDVFNVNIYYKDTKAEFKNTNNFRKIDIDTLHEIISYQPDSTPYKTYTFTAQAVDVTNAVVDTKTYTKTVNNNWDLNKNLLKQYVNSTVITDSSLFIPWINSINEATVLWRNSSNVTINWA